MPLRSTGAIVGVAVVLLFTVAHDIFISDIWFMAGPMLFAGAASGLAIVWSYRAGIRTHSTVAWVGYSGLIALEMVALGFVSLAVLEPQFTMAELLVRDDAFDILIEPSMPLILGAMAAGTLGFWVYFGRRWAALLPVAVTQLIIVFLLGHQFAFLGLVESSTLLARAFAEFALIAGALAAAFCWGVMGATRVLERARPAA